MKTIVSASKLKIRLLTAVVLLAMVLSCCLSGCTGPGNGDSGSRDEHTAEAVPGEHTAEAVPGEHTAEAVPIESTTRAGSGEDTGLSETESAADAISPADAKVPEPYRSDELFPCLSWPGKLLSELDIDESLIKYGTLDLAGEFCGIPVNYGTAYFTKTGDTLRADHLFMLPEGNMSEVTDSMIFNFGPPEEEGEEPYAAAAGGVVSWQVYCRDGVRVRISQGSENDYFEVSSEIAADPADSAHLRRLLPAFMYAGSDPAEAAIDEYIIALAEKERAETDSVCIPAFSYFKAARSEDGRLMVYGSFWTFSYAGAGTTLYCTGGGEMPGVLYLAEEADGRYTVTDFDRFGDGAAYRDALLRITAGDEALRAQYERASNAKEDPVLSSRKRYLEYYITENGLEYSAYKDLGWEAVPLFEEGETVPEPAEGPWKAFLEEELAALKPQTISLDMSWEFADFSAIHTGEAVLYRAKKNRNGLVVGVNAGHGTSGGSSVFTLCHPDGTPKLTGGSTAAGSLRATAVSVGMTFFDGTPERDINLKEARILRDLLLDAGYDVLMLRDGDDVQLDNIARTVICNNNADCHIAIHWDGDGLDYDKGCFVMTVPDGLKTMYPVSEIWQEDDRLGASLIQGLQSVGAPIHGNGLRQLDLTQTSYSKIPSIDIELGNAASDHSDGELWLRAEGLLAGINIFFGRQ